MSGIFKAVKKTIKKVGKVIKKIAPALLIAAAVYFGGAYLMSSGAPTAGAAGSVGTSFTKAGGVWKAFLSGMGNGTASQSAAVFAEASYQTSIGANALPLSGQVAAGTSAVNALSNMGSSADAVAAGVKLARNATAQSGGNVHMMNNIVQEAMASTQTVMEQATIANVSPESAMLQQMEIDSTYDPNKTYLASNVGDDTYQAKLVSDQQSGLINRDMSASAGGAYEGTPADISRQAAGTVFDGESYSATIPKDLSGGPNLVNKAPGGTGTVAPRELTGAQAIAQGNKEWLQLYRDQFAATQKYNQQIATDRNKIATQQMWMQGTGMLLSALGAEEPLEVTKDKRKMAWKPSGKEEYASGAGKMYPGGIIS